MIGYCAFLLAGSYPLLMWEKIQVFLFINHHHHPCLDTFFYYWTHFGSGITYILLLFILYCCGLALHKLCIGLMSFVTMSIVVQTLKRVFFFSQLRPFKVLTDAGQSISLHLVDRVEVLSDFSFPSGHAATIFTAVCFLNLMSNRKHTWYSIVLLLIAIVTGYSRVYLCQHFYTDVYVGAWIGGSITLIVYVMFLHLGLPSWLASRGGIKFKL